MTRNRVAALFLLFSFCAPLRAADALRPELTIAEVLRRAEQVSPELKASAAREAQSREGLRILESLYYPSLEFQAIQSYGYAGSNGALGTSGLISSPFRVGPGAELASKLSLIDVSRTYSVRAARDQLRALEEETRIVRYRLDQALLQIFFEAVRSRGEGDAWREISADIDQVGKEVDRLVRTGQHSPVERFLIQDQISDAAMSGEIAQEKYKIALKRLAIFTGWDEQALACPSPATLSAKELEVIQAEGESPLVAHASAEARAAHAGVSQHAAERYPRVVALASVGDVSKSQLVEKKDYSGGFGLVLPLFEGGHISAGIHQAEAIAAEKENDLLTARLDLDDQNARYDEAIASAEIKLRYLDEEKAAADQSLKLARERYRSFLGPLIEVREALRNLARIETQQSDVKADLFLAAGSKTLLNGATVVKD